LETVSETYIAAIDRPEFFFWNPEPALKYAVRFFDACDLLFRILFRRRFRSNFPVEHLLFFLQSQQFGFFRSYTADDLSPKTEDFRPFGVLRQGIQL
jgi:hypothetical protein